MRYELHAALDEMDWDVHVTNMFLRVERVNSCFSLALLLGEEVQNTLLSFSNLTRNGQKAMIDSGRRDRCQD